MGPGGGGRHTRLRRRRCDLAPLSPQRNLRSQAIAVSPDGKHVYVALWTYHYNALGLLARDEKSGALVFRRQLEVDPNMFGLNCIAFTPDGKTGFYSSGTENSGACLGCFTRDPRSGLLRFGGVAEKSKFGPDHMAFDAATGTIYLAGHAGTKYFNVYRCR